MNGWGGTPDDPFSYPAPLWSLFLLCGRKKKIAPNGVLLVFLAAALAANLLRQENLIYVPLILAVSFALYYAGFWGAGDGKLFFCCAVYLLPFVGDALYAVAFELLLSISLCYFMLFLALVHGKRKSVMQLLRNAAKKAFSADTVIRLLLSFSVLSAISLAGYGSWLRLPALVLFYVLSAALPPAASLAIVLVLSPMLLTSALPLEQYAGLIFWGLLFAFFFSLYSVLAASSGERDRKMVFAPFLFASSLLIMLLS